MATQDGVTFNRLYVDADMALYAAKEGGRNRYALYGDQMAWEKASVSER